MMITLMWKEKRQIYVQKTSLLQPLSQNGQNYDKNDNINMIWMMMMMRPIVDRSKESKLARAHRSSQPDKLLQRAFVSTSGRRLLPALQWKHCTMTWTIYLLQVRLWRSILLYVQLWIDTNVSAVQCTSLEALLSTASNELFKELSTQPNLLNTKWSQCTIASLIKIKLLKILDNFN